MRKLCFRSISFGNPLFVGIAVGIFLGLCLSLFDDQDVDDYLAMFQNELPDPFFTKLPTHLKRGKISKKSDKIISLQCIILLESGDGFKPEKALSAIRDTWTKECNETFYFTDSSVLHRRYFEEMAETSSHIFLLQGHSSPSLDERKIVQNILNFVANQQKMQLKSLKWTILSDGKSYVHAKNLRDLLEIVDENVPIILGQRQQQKPSLYSFFANLLPSTISTSSSSKYPLSSTISTIAPIILSQKAFQLVSKNCWNFGTSKREWWWPFCRGTIFGDGIPRHTGRAIGGCALSMGIALWEPVDEDSQPVIVTDNLRNLFSKYVTKKNSTENKLINSLNMDADSQQQLANCCSDRTIAFGLLNHKDQRLIDFGVRQLKVFGLNRK